MKKKTILITLLMMFLASSAFAVQTNKVLVKFSKNAPQYNVGPTNRDYGTTATYQAYDDQNNPVTGNVVWSLDGKTAYTGAIYTRTADDPGIHNLTSTKNQKSAVMTVVDGPKPEPPLPNLNNPSNVVRDDAGTYYVLDGSKIKKYDSSGNYLGDLGTGQLSDNASYMAIKDGMLYVSDGNCIKKFDSVDGSFDQTIGLGKFSGEAGPIVFNSDGQMAVVDIASFPLGSIKIFDSATGQYQTAGGAGLLNTPTGIASDGTKFYVADAEGRKIKVFKSNGTLDREINQSMGGFTTPTAIAIKGNYLGICDNDLTMGRLLILDLGNLSFVTSKAYSGTRTVLSAATNQWIATNPDTGSYDSLEWQP